MLWLFIVAYGQRSSSRKLCFYYFVKLQRHGAWRLISQLLCHSTRAVEQEQMRRLMTSPLMHSTFALTSQIWAGLASSHVMHAIAGGLKLFVAAES